MFLRDKNQSLSALQGILIDIGVNLARGIAPASHRHISRTKYSGEQLREIRARKGVGRGARDGKWHKVGGFHAIAGMRLYPALIDSIYIHVGPSKNYLEWERKPRRKPRGVAV